MQSPSSVLWFRNDLRISEHPALEAALDRGGPLIPLFIWAPDEEAPWPPGAASRWWLHHSLDSLDAALRKRGSRLIVRKGPTLETLKAVVRQSGASAVCWSRRYEPAVVARDTKIKTALQEMGVVAESFNAALLFEPWDLRSQSGAAYQVFTPFWRALESKLNASAASAPNPIPKAFPSPTEWPCSLNLSDLNLEPRIDWAGGLRETWRPGAEGAKDRWRRFVRESVRDYGDRRDRPDVEGVSRMSPHLHFGEISPRTMWRDLLGAGGYEHSDAYRRQLGWREFAHHLLFHFPHTAERPLRPAFDAMPWHDDAVGLAAWTMGRTGYTLVDAGLRQLWHTGWMHNRVRMIAASLLVKGQLISWIEGARWFWDTLVDADLANNTLGWQWVAGCGADAAPFFRIFNPVLQGEKFDPQGAYVRHWVPELAALPDAWIHKPWGAPAGVLQDAGIRLGEHYPRPIVDHAESRQRALAVLEKLKDRN